MESCHKRIEIFISQECPTIHNIYSSSRMNDALKPARLCPHCHSTALEENEQAQFYCTACGRVIEGIAFSTSVTFANLRMDGQVIDVNGTARCNLERSNRGSV